MKKRILSLSLASTLLISTVALAGGTKDLKSIAEDKIILEIEEQDTATTETEFKYMNHKGKITEVNNEDGFVSIIVDEKDTLASNEASTMSTIKFNISEDTVIVSDKTQDFIKADKLVVGSVVEVSYGKDSPMTMSIPPMTNAGVVVLKEAKEDASQLGVKVEKFNKDNISSDNFLKYNLTKDTVIVDKKGEKLKEEDLADKDLVVFYGPAMTKSIPAQSNAVKIIALGEKAIETPETPEENTEIKVLDRFIQHASENVWADRALTNKMYRSGETVMMPIREVAEDLGYKVSWNGNTKQAELTKGSNFITITANQDNYSFAKMIVKLGKASENKNGTMFVPVNFIEEVMQLEMSVNKDGVMIIK